MSATAMLFGVYGQSPHTILALPVFAWEVSLAIWLIARGFKPSPIIPTGAPSAGMQTPQPVGWAAGGPGGTREDSASSPALRT
jgi:hypothetical protein